MSRALPLLLVLLLSGCLLPDIDVDDWDADGTPDDVDCDPTDPDLNGLDADGDGSSTCDGDCDDDDPAREALDVDGDGVTTCDADCADTDPTVAPGRAELCDGLDNNCDGDLPADEVDGDGDGAPLCFDCDDTDPLVDGLDEDGDGFGPCSEPPDCDEDNAAAYPGAPDPWGDGIDQSCDGVDGTDDDLDGYASNADVGSNQFDCDDGNAAVHEEAVEACDGLDTDCADGLPADERDEDEDGWLPCEDYVEQGGGYEGGGDCEDLFQEVNPEAGEVACDGFDTDCDGMIATSEQDGDGDGYLPCADFEDLEQGLNGGDDCLDTNPDVYPGADEICDGLDSDCDTLVDPIELDTDNDGYVPCGWWQGDDPAIVGHGDCDDSQAGVNPAAPVELCDGLNTDCTGAFDPSEEDFDEDGWLPCAPYVDHGMPLSGGGDCDDTRDAVNPGVAEHPCDGIDTNCDGAPLGADESDADGDTWLACDSFEENSLLFAGGDDCDDAQAGINPGVAELCDGLDSDCDPTSAFLGEEDTDGDGWVECAPYVDHGGPFSGGGDCSELSGDINPGAVESCDGLDTDCDGLVPLDEADADGDNRVECEPYVNRGATYVGGGDCDDSNPLVHPDMVEQVCDGLDDDCNGIMFQFEVDDDGDGWLVCEPYDDRGGGFDGGGDCDDSEASVNPGSGWDDPSDAVDSDCGAGTVTWLGWADATLTGALPSDWAGWSVAGAGDVDGDGLTDVLVGGIDGAGDAGKVWVVPGSALVAGGALDLDSVSTRILGVETNDSLGSAVVAVGDLDSDGLDDVAIGAQAAGSSGAVYVFMGSTLQTSADLDVGDADYTLDGLDGGDEFGVALASGGDVTGDGVDDLVVGAPGVDSGDGNEGAVYVYSGADLSSTTTTADASPTITGFTTGHAVGASVAILGDVGTDGVDEIVVAAPSFGGGAVYVIYGGVAGSLDVGSAAHILFGSSGESAGYSLATGDLDGDGSDDLVIGAPDYGSWGAFYTVPRDTLVSAPNHSLSSLTSIQGDTAGDWLGASLAVGDVNGDGSDDVLAGAPTSDWSGSESGGAWLYLAGSGLATGFADAVFSGVEGGDHAGWSLAVPGDLDGNGSEDVLIGAPTGSSSPAEAGLVHLLLAP